MEFYGYYYKKTILFYAYFFCVYIPLSYSSITHTTELCMLILEIKRIEFRAVKIVRESIR